MRYLTIALTKGRLAEKTLEIKPCFAGTDAGRGNYSDGREKISIWRL